MRRFSTIVLVLLASCAMPALGLSAEPEVSVRAAVQDGFVRFVFSGAGLPQADVTKQGNSKLRIAFKEAVSFAGLGGVGAGIQPAAKLQADSSQSVLLDIEGDTVERFRTLTLGSRLFVDVFTKKAPKAAGGAALPVASEAQAENAQKLPEAQTTEGQAEPAPDAAALANVPATDNAAAANAAAAAVPESVLGAVSQATAAQADAAAPFAGSAVVTIGSTEGVAIAAFERLGYLWVVASQENLNVPPVVTGPDAAALGVPEAVPMDGGSAFRMKMPKGANIRPEGAGLVWRLYVEGKKTPLRSTTLDRDFSNTAEGPQIRMPMNGANSVLRLHDPEMGDDLAVVTAGRSDMRLVSSDRYVDFDVIPAYVGAVLKPKADGLRVAVMPTEVVIGRQGGLHISPEGPRTPVAIETINAAKSGAEKKDAVPRMFNLADWSLGGARQYLDSRRLVDLRVATADESRKVTELIAAAKFMLGQGLGPEGLGYTDMALSYMPLLRDSAEFQAVRGALLALAAQPEDAQAALSSPGLETKEELQLWRAFVLAQQNSMAEAQKLLPAHTLDYLESYPPHVQAIMLPALIEAGLARGDINMAEAMTKLYEKAAPPTEYPESVTAIPYFHGRLALLRGDLEGATTAYREAAEGYAGIYPVKATLGLVERGLSSKTISREDAVAKLERFRYAWRGDRQESEVLQRLGLVYVTGGEQRRGLTILRDAATMAPDEPTREKLVAVMQKAFKELFTGNTREKMSPIEAAAVAAEFAELMPPGTEGEKISLNISDRMMAVDLLDRAAEIVEPLVTGATSTTDALKYAQRAAAIRITDEKPEDALRIIDKALSRPDVEVLPKLDDADLKAFALLRAKAMDQLKKQPQAFVELAAVPEDADVLRLKADIAWGSQKWEMAADAMGKLIAMAHLDATRPPTEEQAQMILNRALALNLSGKLPELEDLRLGYGDIMRRTAYYQPFQLVTRTAREAKLADRGTLLKLVSEVNMFKAVLDDYKKDKPLPKTADNKPENKPADQTDQKDQVEPVEPGQATENKG